MKYATFYRTYEKLIDLDFSHISVQYKVEVIKSTHNSIVYPF